MANGLSNGAMPDKKKKHQKNHPLGVGKKYVETHSSSNAMALDPEERVLHHINGKNMATVQFLKPKHKVVTSVSERRRMTRVSRQTMK